MRSIVRWGTTVVFLMLIPIMAVYAGPEKLNNAEGEYVTEQEFLYLFAETRGYPGIEEGMSAAAILSVIENEIDRELWTDVRGARTLTRGRMAIFLVRYLDWEDQLPVNPTERDYINLLVKEGLLQEGDPNEPVIRDEIMKAVEYAQTEGGGGYYAPPGGGDQGGMDFDGAEEPDEPSEEEGSKFKP